MTTHRVGSPTTTIRTPLGTGTGDVDCGAGVERHRMGRSSVTRAGDCACGAGHSRSPAVPTETVARRHRQAEAATGSCGDRLVVLPGFAAVAGAAARRRAGANRRASESGPRLRCCAVATASRRRHGPRKGSVSASSTIVESHYTPAEFNEKTVTSRGKNELVQGMERGCSLGDRSVQEGRARVRRQETVQRERPRTEVQGRSRISGGVEPRVPDGKEVPILPKRRFIHLG